MSENTVICTVCEQESTEEGMIWACSHCNAPCTELHYIGNNIPVVI